MGYTIYKNVKVLSVKTVQQTHLLRLREIVDPTKERGTYNVTVASFSNVDYEATIGDFKKDIEAGQQVSIAVNDKSQVIAFINHTTGKEGSLKKESLTFSEIASTLFYLAIPSTLVFFISRKAFQTEKYYQLGWAIVAVGIIIILFVLAGITKDIRKSITALKELKNAS